MTMIKDGAGPYMGVRSAGEQYLASAQKMIARLLTTEWTHIQQASTAIANALASDHLVHAFGTGHSHMIVEEMYYRAGGLVQVKPILFDGLMLHDSTARSTALERLPGLASALLADHPISAGDVMLVASNSGGNIASIEMARCAKEAGAFTIAITSLTHATSGTARHSDAPRLHTVVDLVVDNGGVVGDAAVEIPGFDKRVAPTSTVIGAAIVNAIVAESVEMLVNRGRQPEVYTSLNVAADDQEHQARTVSTGDDR